ncbi:FAD-binding oxidoreductase [Rhodobacteraceae bacterium 63075]|nr:FAD-binding oxidoreductase [Rhodobacteraceae bacterium 63075]
MPGALTPELRAALEARLPADTLRDAEPRYLEEPRGKWHGRAGALALPRSADELAQIIRFATENGIAVIPYGGGTGLVSGQVAPGLEAPLLVSLERMRRIRALHADENVIVAEAGTSLAQVQEAAADAQRLFPLSIASQGTAQIGGVLSTNAGGVGVLRYGNARDLCLGVEAVLPSGEVWHGLTRLRKDNTGYDLRGLLIGAEGTLGIITAAALKLVPRPAQKGTALFAVASPEAALAALTLLREIAGEGISAFELISAQGLAFLDETGPDYRAPFAEPRPDWMILVELGLASGPSPQEIFEKFFEAGRADGLLADGIIAQSAAQAADLWHLREAIPEANKRIGSISSHDISLPLGAVPEFITRAGAALDAHGRYRVNCFGHLGDGNLHYNVFPPEGESRDAFMPMAGEVQALVHEIAVSMGGSFSAEHGLGRLKTGDLARFGDPARLAAMRAIKSALDPQGIMNPGAVLPEKD